MAATSFPSSVRPFFGNAATTCATSWRTRSTCFSTNSQGRVRCGQATAAWRNNFFVRSTVGRATKGCSRTAFGRCWASGTYRNKGSGRGAATASSATFSTFATRQTAAASAFAAVGATVFFAYTYSCTRRRYFLCRTRVSR